MAPSTVFWSSAPIAISTDSEVDTEWSPELDPEDLLELQAAEQDPSKIVAKLPKQSARLGYYSTLCLMSNRLIGSGVFTAASVVFPNTQSIGLALLMWVLGSIFVLSGIIVYIELGLTIPRWPFGPDGAKLSTPRSGDALNYFNYMLKKPMFLATCLFGVCFIVLENSAHNAIALGQNILDASHRQATPGKIISIALAANTFCCLLHAISRRWGIIVNNVFGTVKFLILIFVIIVGLIWINPKVARSNFDVETSFSTKNSPKLSYMYAEAFMWVIFPFGAFHQVNYVISELDQPRKLFPRVSFYGVLLVVVLFTGVNFTYAAIIPKEELFTPGGIDVGARLMQLTLGHAGLNNGQLQTLWCTFKSIAVLGNLIVTTFTAARVKQEIAKEGILPYSLVFAENYDFSLGRLFGRKPKKQDVAKSLSSEDTPAATLILHWTITNILVVAVVLSFQPKPYSSTPAYTFLVGVVVYVTNVIKFTFIGFGLLCLRFMPSVRWAEKSEFKHPIISIISASILLLGSVFPLIFMWVPDPTFKYLARTSNLVDWYTAQNTGACLVVFAFLYWVAFRTYISVRSAREGTTLHVKREPKFKHDEAGGLTQMLEIVTLQWKRDIGMRIDDIQETSNAFSPSVSSPTFSSSTPRFRHRAGGRELDGTEVGRAEAYDDGQYQYLARQEKEMHELPSSESEIQMSTNAAYLLSSSRDETLFNNVFP